MSRRNWFRFWVTQYLDGVQGLGDELGLAYTRLFVKMYATGGPLEFNDQKLKHLLEKRPQDVRRIVARLVELGKLSIDNEGFIHNGRTDYELKWMSEKWGGHSAAISEVIEPSSVGSSEPHMEVHNSEKPNEISRAHTIARATSGGRDRREKIERKNSRASSASSTAAPVHSQASPSNEPPPTKTQSDLAGFRAELREILDDGRIDELVKVRRNKRGALTQHAGKLLKAKIASCGLLATQAADTMILRSWISIEPSWLKQRSNGPPGNGNTAMDAYEKIARERGWTNEPDQLPDRHGDAERLPAERGDEQGGAVVDLGKGDWRHH